MGEHAFLSLVIVHQIYSEQPDRQKASGVQESPRVQTASLGYSVHRHYMFITSSLCWSAWFLVLVPVRCVETGFCWDGSGLKAEGETFTNWTKPESTGGSRCILRCIDLMQVRPLPFDWLFLSPPAPFSSVSCLISQSTVFISPK